ncbi:hypothetical protein D9599_25845 [Roseomonas sp. KE2513]|uniref:hypothetical protein n=1 Tax=Roseomonas sp. KE2513 TaxID=2479202 RepID=UPI0018DF1850|nr:hypothetical protein [Roseomonas sp. KE2513]MBI0538979.1 hypothetical protein [Roseomonas sp. KE2513]
MRLIRTAAALLIAIGCSPAKLALAQRAAPAPGAAARAEAQAEPGPLTERDILFAHHRMLGTEPDFRALAVLDVDNRPPPSRPVRNPERERRYLLVLAERRLRAEFTAFDLTRTYRATLRAEILGYDPAHGGIPLRAGLRHGFSMRDATDWDRGFILRFRNPDAISTIPAGPDAAASLLEGAGLASLGKWAGYGVLMVDFVLAGALPTVLELSESPVLANIVSAQARSAEGLPLYDFLLGGAHAAAAVMRRSGIPPLRRAEIAGLRIGMSLPNAQAIALRHHPRAVATSFYDGLPAESGPGTPDCSEGLVADLRAFSLPLPPKDSYASCLSFSPGEADGPEADRVASLVQIRFLPGTSLAALRGEMERKYGTPEEMPTGQLLWLGRDPAREGPPVMLERRADMVELKEGGPQREAGTLLSVTLRQRPATEDDDD